MKTSITPIRAAYAALIFTIIVSTPAYSAIEGFSLYFQADSFIHSETVPIKSALDDWKGNDFERGQHQWTHNWAEAGIRYKHFSLGYLTRMDYDIQFSEDLSEIYWHTSNKVEFDSNETYDAKLKINSFKADGIRFAFHDQYKFISYHVGISFLEAWEFYDGQINGSIRSVSTKDYEFDLALNYHYTEDILFDRNVDKPDGEGYSIDAGFKLHWDKHLFTTDIKDLKGELTWTDAPFTIGIANSNNNSTDENGFIVVNPTLSGHEGITRSHKQNLKTRSQFEYDYQLNENYRIGLINKQQYSHSLQAFSVSFVSISTLKLSYWPDANLIQTNWQKGRFKVSFAIDNISKSEAETLWLSFSLI